MGLLGASRLTREGVPVVDPVWRKLMNRFLSVVGLKRTVHLKSHRKVIVPLTWGFIKPVILIPENHKEWPEDQKSSALLHELSHIKRADFLITLFVRLSQALFWFNPLSWIVFRRMKREQERACDNLVLKSGIKPSTYAANLLLFRGAAGLRWAPQAALLGIYGRSSFSERLASILKQKLTFKEVTMKTKIFFGALVILSLVFIGSARSSEAAPDMVLHQDIYSMNPDILYETGIAIQSAADDTSDQDKKKTEKNQKQEKEQKEKQKEHEQHTIVITNPEGKKTPIEVTILHGDKKEVFQSDKSITIKKGEKGELFILDADGKEMKVIEGKPIRISVKDGTIEMVHLDDVVTADGLIEFAEAEDIEFADGKHVFFIGKEGDKKDLNMFVVTGKDGKIMKLGKEGGHGWVVRSVEGEEGKSLKWTVKKDEGGHAIDFYTKAGKDGKVWIHKDEEGQKEVDIHVDTGKDVKVWTHKDTGKDKDVYVHVSPHTEGKVFSWTEKPDHKGIEESLKKIRENLKKLKAQGADIEESLKSLEELEKKLAKRHEALVDHYDIEKSPVAYSIVKKEKGDKDSKDVYIKMSEGRSAVGYFSGEGEAQVIYSISKGEQSRGVYDKTIARLKKEMPEGVKLEPEFDEESGVIKIKITMKDGESFNKELIKKITDIIEEETIK